MNFFSKHAISLFFESSKCVSNQYSRWSQNHAVQGPVVSPVLEQTLQANTFKCHWDMSGQTVWIDTSKYDHLFYPHKFLIYGYSFFCWKQLSWKWQTLFFQTCLPIPNGPGFRENKTNTSNDGFAEKRCNDMFVQNNDLFSLLLRSSFS